MIVKAICEERILRMSFTLEFIYEVFPDYNGKQPSNTEISEMMTDSRKEILNALFIPIVGENFDAHQSINQAKEKGAIAALWDANHPIPEELKADVTCLHVPDTTEALQDLG